MKYVRVPKELAISEIKKNEFLFSPGRYVRFIPPDTSANTEYVSLDKLIVLRNDNAVVKKNNMYLYAEIGDIDVYTGGVNFRKVKGYQLPSKRPALAKKGDVLVSTVRTYRKGIGYVYDNDNNNNMVTTNAIMNICGVTNYCSGLTLPYIYSFLRSDFFTEQVWSMLNRGVYPRMDPGALDKIIIPISKNDSVIQYVSALTEAIIEKEFEIRIKSQNIYDKIQTELEQNQNDNIFTYEYPNINDIRLEGRLDAAIYDREYKSKIWLVDNYKNGSVTPKDDGFTVIPGPSLEIKLLRTRIDSDYHKPGFYALILPTYITEYGTLEKIPYLGTARKLPLLQVGDIIFGEAGFQKGRSIVLLDGIERCTTNAHGLYARRKDGDVKRSIFFRCIFNWYRSKRLIDLMAVGGSGGHFSPEYFDYLKIPKFTDTMQTEICSLYNNPAKPPKDALCLNNFVEWHSRWNKDLGVWELNKEMNRLQNLLNEMQEKIINGDKIEIVL